MNKRALLDSLAGIILSVTALVLTVSTITQIAVFTVPNEVVVENNAQSISNFVDYYRENPYLFSSNCVTSLKLNHLESFQTGPKEKLFSYVIASEGIYVFDKDNTDKIISEKQYKLDSIREKEFFPFEEPVRLLIDDSQQGNAFLESLTSGAFGRPSLEFSLRGSISSGGVETNTRSETRSFRLDFLLLSPDLEKNAYTIDLYGQETIVTRNFGSLSGPDRRIRAKRGDTISSSKDSLLVFDPENNILFVTSGPISNSIAGYTSCSRKGLLESDRDSIYRNNPQTIDHFYREFVQLRWYQKEKPYGGLIFQWNRDTDSVCIRLEGVDQETISCEELFDLEEDQFDPSLELEEFMILIQLYYEETLQISGKLIADSYASPSCVENPTLYFEDIFIPYTSNNLGNDFFNSDGTILEEFAHRIFSQSWISGLFGGYLNDLSQTQKEKSVLVDTEVIYIYLNDELSNNNPGFYALSPNALLKRSEQGQFNFCFNGEDITLQEFRIDDRGENLDTAFLKNFGFTKDTRFFKLDLKEIVSGDTRYDYEILLSNRQLHNVEEEDE